MILTMVLLVAPTAPAAAAQDMRAAAQEAARQRKELLNRATLEKQTAQTQAQKSRETIFQDKKALNLAIAQKRKENLALAKKNRHIQTKIKTLTSREAKLRATLADMDAVVKELAGFVRISAKDLDTLISHSLRSAIIKGRAEAIQPLVNADKFPAMEDIRTMKDLVMDEILASGQVQIQQANIIDQTGKEVTARCLVLGNFTAAYELNNKVGFLLFSDQSQQLFALSKPPSLVMQKAIKRYMNGEADAVPMDVSKGGAMRQLTHKLSLLEQIPKGGVVVWPILAIALLALLIILERVVFLIRKRLDGTRFMKELKQLMVRQEWEGCDRLFAAHKTKPLARSLAAGMEFRTLKRADMENALQEAILREIPPLERFLSTLGMLAAIAPLMGLLGTVTGMINTFHVITFYGTSDPRMMSGGISEALVTTMLGLCVAIPIMLCHTLLSRQVETMIATMEEKAVALVNAVFILGNREC
ncbi:MAG: MotA/TolQ/ExbB proton channel family protein [Desulfobacterium sp.]|nr:MotA/TolQ/ExbB proton channel family protein [Desulfobacterium sp.]